MPNVIEPNLKDSKSSSFSVLNEKFFKINKALIGESGKFFFYSPLSGIWPLTVLLPTLSFP